MNHYAGIGRLTAAAELKYTASGVAVTKFSVCINDVWKDREGKRQEKSNFFNCVIWGKYGEVMQRLLTKGKQVGIEGKLEQSTWTDGNGNKHSQITINVFDLTLLASPRNENGGSNKSVPEVPKDGKAAAPGTDDIPF
jgi:single-strand DNA-binding protein